MTSAYPPGIRPHGNHLYAQVPVAHGSRSNVRVKVCCENHGAQWRTAALSANKAGEPRPDPKDFLGCTTDAPVTAPRTGCGDAPLAETTRPPKTRMTTEELIDAHMEYRCRFRDGGAMGVASYATLNYHARLLKQLLKDHPDPRRLNWRFVDTVPTLLRDSGGLKGGHLAEATAHSVIQLARTVWGWGVDRDLVRKNPFTRKIVALPGVKPTARQPSLPLVLIRRLVLAMPAHWRLFVWLLVLLGLRRAEAMGLRLCDIDIPRRMVHVAWQGGKVFRRLTRNGEELVHHVEGLKNCRSPEDPVKRFIVLPECLIPIIMWHIHTFHRDLGDDWATSTRPLIVNPDPRTKVTSVNPIYRPFDHARSASGLAQAPDSLYKEITLHYFRHWISDVLRGQRNGNDFTGRHVSAFLGHAGSEKTFDGRDAASDITINVYSLGHTWNPGEALQRGLLAVAAEIDLMVREDLGGKLLEEHTVEATEERWITTAEFAEMLGFLEPSAMGIVKRNLQQYAVREIGRKGRRWLIPETIARAFMAGRPDTYTVEVAAAMLGRSVNSIWAAHRHGTMDFVQSDFGRWEVLKESMHNAQRVAQSTVCADKNSVTLARAAEFLHTTDGRVEAMIQSGQLVRDPAASPGTVTWRSVESAASDPSSHFVVRPAKAVEILGCDLDEYTQLVARGVLDTTAEGFVTTLSIDRLLLSRATAVVGQTG